MEVGRLLTAMMLIVIPIVALIVILLISRGFVGEECKAAIFGNTNQILSSLRTCVEKCWGKHSYGKDIYTDDCFTVKVSPNKTIEKENAEGFLAKVPTRAFFDSLEEQKNYRVKVRYNPTKPEIQLVLECDFVPKSFDSLVLCEKKSVVSLLDNILVIGDSTQYIRCCSEFTKPFEDLFINSLKYFGGSNILFVWEDPNADPGAIDRALLFFRLKSEGFVVSTLKHDRLLTVEDLKPFDQIVLLRPGICENKDLKSYCNYIWQSSEFDSLKEYLSTGKIILVSDYGNLVPQRVGNRIISLVNGNITFVPGCFCGCKGLTVDAEKIEQHTVTENLNFYPIDAATGIQNKCILD